MIIPRSLVINNLRKLQMDSTLDRPCSLRTSSGGNAPHSSDSSLPQAKSGAIRNLASTFFFSLPLSLSVSETLCFRTRKHVRWVIARTFACGLEKYARCENTRWISCEEVRRRERKTNEWLEKNKGGEREMLKRKTRMGWRPLGKLAKPQNLPWIEHFRIDVVQFARPFWLPRLSSSSSHLLPTAAGHEAHADALLTSAKRPSRIPKSLPH